MFGCKARQTIGADSSGKYFICTLRSRDVAAVGSERGGDAPSVPAWRTYILAESTLLGVSMLAIEGQLVEIEAIAVLE